MSINSRNLVPRKAVATTYYCMKRNVALEIGPMTPLLSLVDNDVIIIYYAILHYTTTIRT